MSKKILKRLALLGIVGGVVVCTGYTISDDVKEAYKEELYSLTPDEVDAYDEYDIDELERELNGEYSDELYRRETYTIPVVHEASYYSPVSTMVVSYDGNALNDLFNRTDEKVSDSNSYNGNINNNSYSNEVNSNSTYYDVEVPSNNHNNPVVTTNPDQVVTGYFDSELRDMNNYLASDDYDNLKSKAKEIITTGIDFLFFDGTINGIDKDKVSEEAKKSIMLNITSTLDFIDEFYPGFSTSFGIKYLKAKEFLNEKYLGALDVVKNLIGEDAYGSASDFFSDMKETYGKAKEEISDLYQGWKMN